MSTPSNSLRRQALPAAGPDPLTAASFIASAVKDVLDDAMSATAKEAIEVAS